MNSAVRRGIFVRRTETIYSFLLALACMAVIAVLAGNVVLWNIQAFKEHVERFFSVDLDTSPVTAQRPYAREHAANMVQELIRGHGTGIFSSLPGAPREMPSSQRMALTPQPAVMPGAAETGARPDDRHDIHGEDERSARQKAAQTELPLIAVRNVALAGMEPVRGLGVLKASGRGPLASLGRPGETVLVPSAAEMPPAPGSRSLQVTPGPALLETLAKAAEMVPPAQDIPVRKYPSLDDDVRAVFSVYHEDGAEDAYFRLELSLRPKSRIKNTPKDILFLVDISRSISVAELKRIRKAVVDYLSHLDKADRWNIIIFSEKSHLLHRDNCFVSPGRFNADQVGQFITRREGERLTDVFRATQVILSKVPQTNRPCNVFLISDGKVTQGTTDVRRIVHDFQRVNRDNFSIFTFNPDPDGNLFLLSLLSYRSRGYFENCSGSKRIEESLSRFLGQYGAPVLTNVVASYTSIDDKEVYPEVLPNMYRRVPVTFLGDAKPGKEVTLRVIGLAEGEPREFFFRATVPEGDDSNSEIVRDWARGKAFALMAKLVDDPQNKRLRKEVLDLADKYKLDEIREMIARE